MSKISKVINVPFLQLKQRFRCVFSSSFVSDLLEKGTDLRYIQHILGHNNSKTTEIYTHITQVGMEKIKNPLDDFDFS